MLFSGQTVVAGGKLPVTSLCSGGETFMGGRLVIDYAPPAGHAFTGGATTISVKTKKPCAPERIGAQDFIY